MLKIVSSVCAAAMALAIPFAAPAAAAPVGAPAWTQGNVVNVQYRDEDGRYRGWRGGDSRRNDGDRRWRRGDRDHGVYNGHRGYREYRRGYRQHNGFWFPPAAFIAGAIIGNAIQGQQPPVRYVPRAGNAHVEWCYNRYRSYRASDNTFQPYNGPRQRCYSPYS